MIGRQVLGLGLDQPHGDGLSVNVYLDPKGVVHPAPRLFPWLAVNDLDGPGCLLAADQLFRPASGVDRRVNQLRAGVGFAKLHVNGSMICYHKTAGKAILESYDYAV